MVFKAEYIDLILENLKRYVLDQLLRYPVCEPFSCLQKPDADERKADTRRAQDFIFP